MSVIFHLLVGLAFALLLNSRVSQPGGQGNPQGLLHHAMGVHRHDHRHHLAPAPGSRRRGHLRPSRRGYSARGDAVVLDGKRRAARTDVRQHLGRVPFLHGKPARRPAGNPQRAVRGLHHRRGERAAEVLAHHGPAACAHHHQHRHAGFHLDHAGVPPGLDDHGRRSPARNRSAGNLHVQDRFRDPEVLPRLGERRDRPHALHVRGVLLRAAVSGRWTEANASTAGTDSPAHMDQPHRHVLGLAIGLVFAGFPVLWMLVSSVKSNTEIFSNPPTACSRRSSPCVPTTPSSAILPRSGSSSTATSWRPSVTVLTLLVAIMAGYAFSRLHVQAEKTAQPVHHQHADCSPDHSHDSRISGWWWPSGCTTRTSR